MGTWNATCHLSHLPILPGDRCVGFLLRVSEFGTHHLNSLPLLGTYDAGGAIYYDGDEEIERFTVDFVKTYFSHHETWEAEFRPSATLTADQLDITTIINEAERAVCRGDQKIWLNSWTGREEDRKYHHEWILMHEFAFDIFARNPDRRQYYDKAEWVGYLGEDKRRTEKRDVFIDKFIRNPPEFVSHEETDSIESSNLREQMVDLLTQISWDSYSYTSSRPFLRHLMKFSRDNPEARPVLANACKETLNFILSIEEGRRDIIPSRAGAGAQHQFLDLHIRLAKEVTRHVTERGTRKLKDAGLERQLWNNKK